MIFKQKKKEPETQITFSQAQAVIESAKPKTRFTTKLYFWIFILLTIFSVFLFWSASQNKLLKIKSPIGANANIAVGIIALVLAVFFALICFVRFIRSRSIAGGLFLTTCISTGVFLGTSQLLPIVVPSTAAAFTAAPDVTNNGLALMVGLAQVGLFAVWFAFLLFVIYLHVRPVKRIDKILQKIVDGEKVKHIRLGKARQYLSIAEKLTIISKTTFETHVNDAKMASITSTPQAAADTPPLSIDSSQANCGTAAV